MKALPAGDGVTQEEWTSNGGMGWIFVLAMEHFLGLFRMESGYGNVKDEASTANVYMTVTRLALFCVVVLELAVYGCIIRSAFLACGMKSCYQPALIFL